MATTPQTTSYQSQRVNEGWPLFGVPSRRAHELRLPLDQLCGQPRDQGEQAEEGWRGARYRQIIPLALRLNAQVGTRFFKGHFHVQQGLTLARDVGFQFVIGLAPRALGRIAQASGVRTEAATHFTAALQTFTTRQARFEHARTELDLAALAQAQGNPQAAATHLTAAYTLFQTLQVPRYVERVTQCASACGVALPARRRRRM